MLINFFCYKQSLFLPLTIHFFYITHKKFFGNEDFFVSINFFCYKQ